MSVIKRLNISASSWYDLYEELNIPVGSTIQLTNQGASQVYIDESFTMPSESVSGELLSTYDKNYASVIISPEADNRIFVKTNNSTGSVVSVQVVGGN